MFQLSLHICYWPKCVCYQQNSSMRCSGARVVIRQHSSTRVPTKSLLRCLVLVINIIASLSHRRTHSLTGCSIITDSMSSISSNKTKAKLPVPVSTAGSQSYNGTGITTTTTAECVQFARPDARDKLSPYYIRRRRSVGRRPPAINGCLDG